MNSLRWLCGLVTQAGVSAVNEQIRYTILVVSRNELTERVNLPVHLVYRVRDARSLFNDVQAGCGMCTYILYVIEL